MLHLRRYCGAKLRITLVFALAWLVIYVLMGNIKEYRVELSQEYEAYNAGFITDDGEQLQTGMKASNYVDILKVDSKAADTDEQKTTQNPLYFAVLEQMQLVRRQIIESEENDTFSPNAFQRSFNISTMDEDSLDIGTALRNKTTKCNTFLYEFAREKTIVPYVAKPRHSIDIQDRLCLVTTISDSRIHELHNILSAWPGCISLVVYLERQQTQTVLDLLRTVLPALQDKTSVHFVYKGKTPLLPINFLRNLAILTTTAEYILYIDVDLMPSAGLYDRLQRYIESNTFNIAQNTAIIIPAFSLKENTAGIPKSKSDIVDLVKDKQAEPFYIKSYKPAYGPTDYARWMTATESYDVHVDCYAEFEPYVFVRQRHILYKEVFVQRFINKAIYFTELCLRRYSFIVEPNEFLTHIPHKHSTSKLSYTYGLKYCAYTSYKIHYRINSKKHKYKSRASVVRSRF